MENSKKTPLSAAVTVRKQLFKSRITDIRKLEKGSAA
jgi:hypothetical protein